MIAYAYVKPLVIDIVGREQYNEWEKIYGEYMITIVYETPLYCMNHLKRKWFESQQKFDARKKNEFIDVMGYHLSKTKEISDFIKEKKAWLQ